MDGPEPLLLALRCAGPMGLGRRRISGRLAVRVVVGRTRRTAAATPTPAPARFRLFAVRHPSDSSWHDPVFRRCSPLGRDGDAAAAF